MLQLRATGLIIALVALCLAGCAGQPSAPPCFPPDYTVTPDRAAAGQLVTVSAPDATCDPRYGSGAQIEVTLVDAEGRTLVR